MARDDTVTLTAGAWTQLTNGDVTNITFQNRSDYDMFIAGTTDATAPTDFSDALKYGPGMGEKNAAMTDLFPGLSGGDRVYAYSKEAIDVRVSHA